MEVISQQLLYAPLHDDYMPCSPAAFLNRCHASDTDHEQELVLRRDISQCAVTLFDQRVLRQYPRERETLQASICYVRPGVMDWRILFDFGQAAMPRQ